MSLVFNICSLTVVPLYQLNSFSRQRFAVVSPLTWNSLPDSLRDPQLSLDISNVS